MAKTDGLVTWNPELVTGRLRATVERNMGQAVLYLEARVKRKISIRNEPRVRVGRSGMRGLNPSEPGDPPKLVTGTLRANIGTAVVSRPDAVIGFVGVKKGPAEKYGRRLELGFTGVDAAGRHVNQPARPFLRPTVLEERSEVYKRLIK